MLSGTVSPRGMPAFTFGLSSAKPNVSESFRVTSTATQRDHPHDIIYTQRAGTRTPTLTGQGWSETQDGTSENASAPSESNTTTNNYNPPKLSLQTHKHIYTPLTPQTRDPDCERNNETPKNTAVGTLTRRDSYARVRRYEYACAGLLERCDVRL